MQGTFFDKSPLPTNQYGFELEHSSEPKSLSRRSDPATSRAAAKRVQISNCERIFLDTLRSLGRATAYEVAAASKAKNPETIRKRAGGLKRKGLIRVVSYGVHPTTGNSVERFEVIE